MKKILTVSFLFFVACNMFGQDQIDTYIKDAQTAIAAKDYRSAQLSLQDAINELNNLIAQQIAEALPAEINGLKAEGDASTNSASLGAMGGGIMISQSYSNPSNENNEAEINIVANSPMIATMGMYLSNPAMLGEGYKSVKVGTQRAILKSEMEEKFVEDGKPYIQVRSTEIQIPLGQTLITMDLSGFASEADELSFASKLDLAKLKLALGE